MVVRWSGLEPLGGRRGTECRLPALSRWRAVYGKGNADHKGLEIFETGTWNGDTYTLQDIKDMITASEHVGFEAPLKLGHMEDDDTKALLKKEGMPAFGWIKNLRIKGNKLIADITNIPKTIAELIERKAYQRVSAEIYWNFKKGQDTFRRVLKAFVE